MTLQDINSSTDSSSGSSSDSSSSGSSSSSSGSASSSSDSESTTSETPAVAAAAAAAAAAATAAVTAAAAAPAAVTPPLPPPPPAAPKSPKPTSEDSQCNNKKAEEKPATRSSVAKVLSSSEDDIPIPVTPKPLPGRRRSSTKPKPGSTQPKQGKPASTIDNDKPKPSPKPAPKSKSDGALKKKSIFSPDNSSESESEDQNSKSSSSAKTPPLTRGKGRTRKQSKEGGKVTPPKNEEVKENNTKRRNGNATSGPPSKKSADEKHSASSCSTSQSSSDSDTVDSSSEPDPVKKQPELKTGKTRSNSIKSSSNSKSESTSKSANSDDSIAGSMPRKLTRSLSARVSRLAAISRPTNTDTDSDAEDRVEKSVETKKGRGRSIKSPAAVLMLPETLDPKERSCPVAGCDSSGHLGGLTDKHFTWDACPVYHNVSGAWCVAAAEERAAAAVARQRALQDLRDRPRAQPGIEHRAYQLKVKDMRSKWKGSQELREKLATVEDNENADREPILEGFVPDYDLRLFREAQALAAISVEEELQDIPTDRGTKYLVMGKYLMEVWYQSPYPGTAARAPRLFVCEFCLNHHQSAAGAARHNAKCVWRHPPGDEVYRKNDVSVWQVDGRKHKQYCQQLCLLAKFFLDHKTLYYDVEPFLFYVMTLADKEGCHIVGYFSKEKNSFLNYNVSCILTLPPYQRQGYGRLLIDFSYLLTKVEGKVGSPETPLSDLGLISYRSYWKEALLKRLCSAHGSSLSIRDLSKDLAIASCDIVSTLQERGLMKYWKGKHIVLKKQDVLEEASRRAERASCVDPACLRWTPPAAPPPR